MALMSLYNQIKLVDVFNLEKKHLQLETMAHSLSQLNRYTGHALFPYSVAQHSWLLWLCVPAHLRRCALIHDWSEAFTNDIAYPVKVTLPEYTKVEEGIQRRIFELMGEPWENIEELHYYDKQICVNEMAVLFPGNPNVMKGEPLGIFVTETSWEAMKEVYLGTLKLVFPDWRDTK